MKRKNVTEETPEQQEPVVTEQENNNEATEAVNNAANTANSTTASDNEVEKLTQEIAELKDKNLRLMAEFDNYRKRTLKEKSELILNAGEDLLKRMLPLIDDFERALQAMDQSTDAQALKEGVDLIYTKFIGFLSENGVKPIPTDKEDFNTDLHEAVTTFPAPTEDLKGKIIECLTKGYIMREKVIRYSQVVVGE
jgi:molecular chaperone GrpE